MSLKEIALWKLKRDCSNPYWPISSQSERKNKIILMAKVEKVWLSVITIAWCTCNTFDKSRDISK